MALLALAWAVLLLMVADVAIDDVSYNPLASEQSSLTVADAQAHSEVGVNAALQLQLRTR